MRERIRIAALAAAAALLAACSADPAAGRSVATARDPLITIPPDAAFSPFLCSGPSAGDVAGDPVTGGEFRDIVGDATHPAFYRAADADFVFFRMRLDADPRKPGSATELQPSSWDVLVDTDGDLSTYEYMLTADGNLPGGTGVQWVRNSVKEPGNPMDPAFDDKRNDLVADLVPASDYWAVKEAADGSAFGGNPDYFITLVIPKSILVASGLDLTKKFVVWAGTNAQTYSLNSDFGCYVGIPPTLGDAGNEPGTLEPSVPDAVDDVARTAEDTPVVTDVLANDTGLRDTPIRLEIAVAPAHGAATVGADQRVTYTPAPDWNGTDAYTYRITDSDGESDTAVVTVTVTPVDDGPPVATPDAATLAEGTSIAVDVLANDRVPDGVAAVAVVSGPAHGSAVVNADRTVSYTPEQSYFGSDTLTYEVTDSDGQTATAVVAITVTPVDSGPPVATADAVTTAEDTAVVVAVLANDSIPDGVASVEIATLPAHGAAVVRADGTVTYTPAPDYFGPDAFTYRVTDGDGQSATAPVAVTVTPVSDGPPVANADAVTTAEDTAVVVAVLANDVVTDGVASLEIARSPAHGTAVANPDGTVTYTPAPDTFGPDAFTYRVTDRDGESATADVVVTVTPVDDGPPVAMPDTATVRESTAAALDVLANDVVTDGIAGLAVATAPAHGTALVNADRTIEYAPEPNYFGPDAFTYEVTDGDGQTATAEVLVTVTPADSGPPVVGADALSTPEDTPGVVDVLANDVVLDPPASVRIAVDGVHGTAAVNGDGTITYTPAHDYTGPDAFTYEVTDGDGQAATGVVAVVVTPVNDGPVANPDVATGAQWPPIIVPVLANDTDGDGDPLHVTSVTQGSHGTVSVQPDGTVQYVAAPGFVGVDTFTYSMTDGKAAASGIVTVNVLPAFGVRGGGCASGPGGGAGSLLLVALAVWLPRRVRRRPAAR
jgi:Bacterial Ig domain